MSTPDEMRSRFWTWFRSHAERLRRAFTAAESASSTELLVDEIGDQLHRYDVRLYPLIGASADGSCELIVTAEGNAEAFPSVFDLVAVALPIDAWTFTPLKPRFGEVDPITSVAHDGIVLSLEATRFAIRVEADRHRLAILVADHDQGDAMAYRFAALQLVEALIGEYDLATRVSAVDVLPLSVFRSAAGHDGRPLIALLEAIPPRLRA